MDEKDKDVVPVNLEDTLARDEALIESVMKEAASQKQEAGPKA